MAKNSSFKAFLKALWLFFYQKHHHLLTPLFVLLLTLVLWALQSTLPQVSAYVEPGMFIVGLFFLGIPHGAIDHLLETNNLNTKPNLNFIIRYVSAAAIYLGIWFIFPNLALIFFLVYSAWHFGQGDMNEWQPHHTNNLKSWTWGTLILVIVLGGHVAETNTILTNMCVFNIPLNDKEGKIASAFFILLALLWAIVKQQPAMLISCMMLALGTQLPLITAFGLYFIGQHSVNGWSHLKRGLKVGNKDLFLKALPFSLRAFLLFVVIFLILQSSWLNYSNDRIIATFFVFISCISFPHVIAMHKFYKKSV